MIIISSSSSNSTQFCSLQASFSEHHLAQQEIGTCNRLVSVAVVAVVAVATVVAVSVVAVAAVSVVAVVAVATL